MFMATYRQYYYTLPSGIELIMVGGLDERIYMILNDLSCYEVIKILEESVFTYILINLYQNESDYQCSFIITFKAMQKFQKFGLCLDPSKKYDMLDEIGSHFLDQAVELTRPGGQFCVVLDNIDWEIKVHDMRQEDQNVSEHAVASTIVF